jgi:hypothetical protein
MRRIGLLLFALLTVPCALAREVAILTTPPPFSGVTLTGVMPSQVSPDGGQTVTITGTGFAVPVRVFVDPGDGSNPIEIPVLSVTSNAIQVVSPRIDVTPRGWRTASVAVVSHAGSTSELRATAPNTLRFVAFDITPQVIVVSPSEGPAAGTTRITLFGDGFQSPLELLAVHPDGSETEVQVIKVALDQVVAIVPPGKTEEHLGFHVRNVGNGKSTSVSDAFHYYTAAPLSVSSVNPSSGPYSGGTPVTIDGDGFGDASVGYTVTVVIGGLPAQSVTVRNQQIVAVTSPVSDPQCSDHTGDVVVTRTDTGESVIAAPFTFLTPHADFVTVPSAVLPGAPLDVTVQNTSDVTLFYLDGQRLEYDADVKNGDGTTTYRLRLPADLDFPRHGCRALAITATLRLTDMRTGCSASRALTIRPVQNSDPCRQPRDP